MKRYSLLLATLFLLVTALSPVAAAGDSLSLRATYRVQAALDHGDGTLLVRSDALVTNPTSGSISSIVFNLAPARIGALDLRVVKVDGSNASAVVRDQSVVVRLPGSLAPGASTTVRIRYTARFGGHGEDKQWLFAKLKGVITAYRWIPWLSREVAFDRDNIGDPFVTPSSSRVEVTIKSERSLSYATSGLRASVSADGLTQTFLARDVRDFNFAAHPSYRVSRAWAGDTELVAYTRTLDPAPLLRWGKRAIAHYEKKVGPYLWPRMAIAESGRSAMESPAMIWIARDTPSWNIPYLVAHETAHQWFYGAVGNDQTSQPFADEAPTDFLARHLLDARRAPRSCAGNLLDRTIYEYGTPCYYETIYIGGGNYIDDLRKRAGNDAFWAALRSYYSRYSHEMGSTTALLDAIDAAIADDLTTHYSKRFPRYY